MNANVTDGPQELCGLRLRPFSLGTLDLCRQLGLTMFSEGKVPADAADRMHQVAAYLFVQSEPLEDVLRAADDPDFEKAYLRPFKFRLLPGTMEKAWSLIEDNLSRAGEASVDIEPKPGIKLADPPPNS